jgi:hypothetical protein
VNYILEEVQNMSKKTAAELSVIDPARPNANGQPGSFNAIFWSAKPYVLPGRHKQWQ